MRPLAYTVVVFVAVLLGPAVTAQPPDSGGVTPEPQGVSAPGAPPAMAQAPTVPPVPGAATGTPIPLAPPLQTMTSTAQAVRLGEPGNVVRMVGVRTTQLILSISHVRAEVDKLDGADLLSYASTLAIGPSTRVGQLSPTHLRIVPGEFLGRPSTGTLSWFVTVEADALPANSSESRVTSVLLGPDPRRERYLLEFTLTNTPPLTAQFDVLAPGHEWFVSRSDGDAERVYPLLLSNRSEAVSGVRLAQVSLVRSDRGGDLGPGDMTMIGASGAEAIDLQPFETRTVFLRLEPSRRFARYGSFSGQVQLIGNGTGPKPVPLTVQVTSTGVRLVGSVLVLAGLLTSLFVDVLLERTAMLAATIWAGVSLAVGLVYVFSDVDFGTPVDLLGMFLWGLGVTSFGAGVQQLTSRSIGAQVGVTVPRLASGLPAA